MDAEPLLYICKKIEIVNELNNLQSKLNTIGESRMEMDYRLVENEGLFQEYLEMGKKSHDL